MSRHNKKSSQFPTGKSQRTSPPIASQSDGPQPLASKPLRLDSSPSPLPALNYPVRPEQVSLDAYAHIQTCLKGREHLEKEEVTAILQLSQHLRVFGLLSAVGYLKHAREGEVKKRTQPMWLPLLWRLVCGSESLGQEEELLKKVEQMARNESALYMTTWRKALTLSQHWNFWARAYQKEGKSDVHSTLVG
jgi:hypothetical protein